MKLDFDTIVKNFYDEYKDSEELKDYTFVQVSNMVKAPFKYLRQSVIKGLFYDIRFIGLGVFRVSKWRVVNAHKRYGKLMKINRDRGEKDSIYKFLCGVRDRLKIQIDKMEKDEN